MEQQLSNISVEFNITFPPDQIPKILINRNLASLLGIIKLNEVVDASLVDIEGHTPFFTGILSFNGNLFKAAIPEALYYEFESCSGTGKGYYMPLKLAVSFVSNDAVILNVVKTTSTSSREGLLKLMSAVNENFVRIAESTFLNEFNNKLSLNTNNLSNLSPTIKNDTLVFNFNFNLNALPIGDASVVMPAKKEDIGKDKNKEREDKEEKNKEDKESVGAGKTTGGDKAVSGDISPDSTNILSDAEFIRRLKNRILSSLHLKADRLSEIKSKIEMGTYADSSKIADGILKASENKF